MHRRRCLSAVLLATAVLTSACGARLTADQEAEFQRRVAGGDAVAGAAVDAGSTAAPGGAPAAAADAAADTPGGDSSPTPVASGPAGQTSGGTATAPGAAPSGQDGTVSSQDCHAASQGVQEVGVTDDRILLGNVSLLSGAIQGFANTAVGGAKAFVAYQNSRGGVCGRALELSVADDRFDSGTNRSEHDRLSREVLAFVGSLSVVDDGGVSVLRDTNIPDVSLALSDEKLALRNSVSPTPIDVEAKSLGAVPLVQYFMETEGITDFALIWPAQATARNRAGDYRNDFLDAGLESAYESEVAVTETNYTPHAAAICAAEPDALLLTTVLEVNGMARLMKAIRQQGCLPKLANVGTQAYGAQYPELAGEAANGTRIILQSDIVEGTDVPLTKAFAEWFRRVNPGLVPDYFAVQGWVAGHLLVTAMTNAGPELTRDRVLSELLALDGYDGEGMIVPIDPVAKERAPCFMVAAVVDGAWVREDPPSGFRCV